MTANPGAIIDRNVAPTVWFKGGADRGVFFASWLATGPDGRLTVVAGGVADSTSNVESDPTLIQLLARGLALDRPPGWAPTGRHADRRRADPAALIVDGTLRSRLARQRTVIRGYAP